MAEIIVFPDVEALVVSALNADDRMPASWSTKVPNPRPAEFGRARRFGGPRESLISEDAQLILEVWASSVDARGQGAPDEARAAFLLNVARGILASQDGPLFGYSELGGPNNLPDPTVPDMARYTLNVGVRVRGLVLA